MKKRLIGLSVLCLVLGHTFLSAQTYQQGTKNVNIGIGSDLYYGFIVNASADVAIQDNFSVGAYGSLNSGYYSNVMALTAGARAAYHIGETIKSVSGFTDEKLDIYLGVSLGFLLNNRDLYIFRKTPLGAFLGARYQIKDNIGFYFEGGLPYNTLGLTFKF
jgi:hypothetical protein